jgi:hypothetical protein
MSIREVFGYLVKPIALLRISNIILILVVLGLLVSFKVVGIILLGILRLLLLSIPTVIATFVFSQYKRLRGAYEKLFAFFLSI